MKHRSSISAETLKQQIMSSKTGQNYNFLSATGKIPYNMTNDYMFRMVLQNSEDTLINLVCSVLHLSRDDIESIKIENPILPGDAIDEKEYQMDVMVILNNNTHINLEMQVINYKNWPERSVAYLSRKFNDLSKGKDYSKIEPVYHIGFLDFAPFEDHSEFFAKYHIRNDRDNFLYTDKFNLYVIELNRADLATEDDKRYSIDVWAQFFKATTWEEIKMITKDNPSMNSTAESVYLSNSDFVIRERCRAREDAIIHEKYQAEQIEALTSEVSTLSNEISVLTSENNALSTEIERLHRLLEEHGIKAE